MPVVVYATDTAAEDVGFDARHVHIITEKGARIVHRADHRDDTFRPAIEAALAK